MDGGDGGDGVCVRIGRTPQDGGVAVAAEHAQVVRGDIAMVPTGD